MFPHHEMTILDYNRRDARSERPQPRSSSSPSCAKRFSVAASDAPVRPAASGEFGMYLAGRWYRLTIRPDSSPARSDRPAADDAADRK